MVGDIKRRLLCGATYTVAVALHLVERPKIQFDEATWKYIREHPELKMVPSASGQSSFKMVPR